MREAGKQAHTYPLCNPAARSATTGSCAAAAASRDYEQSLAHHPNHLGEPVASDSIRALRNATQRTVPNMGKKRRRTSNQRDDTWTKGPEKPADAARRLKCARARDYYRQQLGLDDEEWRRMMATFRKPLPATFRVTAPDGLARKIGAS